jgi:L-ornithine Nalpha-acyltransferase
MIANDPHLQVRLARDEADVLAAQRLRYQVFVTELGGDGPMVDHARQLERDRFDAYVDNLVLIDTRRDAAALQHVVGVYRLLRQDAAERAGRFYSESEYDLQPLRADGRRLLELGRSCVSREHRGGLALFHLWHGLADYVVRHRIELLFGVASFHGTDPGALALPLSYLHHRHLAPPTLRVRARDAVFKSMDLMPASALDRVAAMRAMPSLIKAYLRVGGCVGQGAFVDMDFNTTDVCLMLDTARMSARQRRLYAGGVAP